MVDSRRDEQIDFRELLGIIRRHMRSIVGIALLFLVLGVAFVFQRAAVYSATATVTVAAMNVDPLSSSNLMAQMPNEVKKPTSDQLLGGAEGVAVQLQTTPDDLRKRITVTNPSTTTILDITCTGPTAVAAQRCASVVANAYIDDRKATAAALDAPRKQLLDEIARLQTKITNGDTSAQTEAQLFQLQTQASNMPAYQIPAILSVDPDLAKAPDNKGFITTGILFAFVGLIVGVAFALIRERLKDPIVDRDRMAASLGAPTLAVVPKLSRWRGRRDPRPVLMRAPDNPASQAYKAARSTLLHAAAGRPLQVIAVVGPGLGDGKTTTTANLAVALAQSGKTVVAVSCDLARPRLHVLFGAGNNVGLAEVLTGLVPLADVIQHTTEPGLSVIASGRVSEIAPEVLLGGDQMEELLETLRGQFDLVLLDTAPALLVADPLYLAPLTDGVVVVADATHTSRAAVDDVKDTFERVGAWIIGGIVNRAVMKKARYLSRESRATRDPRTQARTPAPIPEPPKPKALPKKKTIDIDAVAAAAAERQPRFRRPAPRAPVAQLSDEESFRARLREETARPREAGDTFCVGVLRVGLRTGDEEEVAHVPNAESLRRVADAVHLTMPDGSTMAYLGGGMFAAVLPELRRPEAQGLLVGWEAAAGARLDDEHRNGDVSVRVSAGLCAFQDGAFSGNREAKKIAYEMSDIGVVRQPAKPRAKSKPKSKPKSKVEQQKPATDQQLRAEQKPATEQTPASERQQEPRREQQPATQKQQPPTEQQRPRPEQQPAAERQQPAPERQQPQGERPQQPAPSVNLIDLSGNGDGGSEPEVVKEPAKKEQHDDAAPSHNGERSQPDWHGGSSIGARPDRPDTGGPPPS